MLETAKNKIVEQITAQMTEKNISQAEWARQNRGVVSESHLGNVLKKENWDKVSDKVWQSLAGLLLTDSSWSIFTTDNFRTIQNACTDAQQNQRFVAVYGYTGAGKTTALMRYNSKNQNTWYLVVRSSYSRKDMIQRIADAMGVQAMGGRTIDLEDAIIEKLTTTPNALLILDSVSKLNKDNSLQFIGDLAEAVEGRAGILVAGTEYLKDYIEKGVRLNKRGFREMNRRIYSWTTVVPFHQNRAEIVAICQDNGITNPKQIATIIEDSKCFGSLKIAIERMKNALQKTNSPT